MAMEIIANDSTYRTDYADRLQREREEAAGAENSRNGEKTTKGGSGQNGELVSERKPVQQDEYISSEKAGEKPNGLYHVGQDENGNKKVYFNDPKKAGEKCVGNTDKVDREIRELKEKKKKLEQQLKAASGDEKKTKELESKLAQVERELGQKDNDTYRRQHSTFTDK